jgi:RND family efflux transporter MFP subunit
VEEGQILFIIEQALYEAARNEAAASVASAKAQLQKAQADLRRVEVAAEKKAVSEQEVDLARAARSVAEAAVTSAEARLDRVQLDLEYTEVRSPIAGMVDEDLAGVSNLVGYDGPTLLTTVRALDPLYVDFEVPEQSLLRLLQLTGRTPGQPAEGRGYPVFVGTQVDEGFPHEGAIDFMENTVDPDTGTIRLRATVPNPETKLIPGVFVRVRVPAEELGDALVVEERGVGRDLGGPYVYFVGQENVVEQRYVKLGPQQDDGTVVVLEGLDAGDLYIVEGLLRARPGAPVQPVVNKQPAEEAQ